MNQMNQIYKKHVQHELALISNKEYGVLNTNKVEIKILAFLNDLGSVSEESQCISFWDKHPVIDQEALKNTYMEGLQMLLSIGFELHVDALKNHHEIEMKASLEKQFLKVYDSVLKIKNTFNFEDYQNSVEDYLALGTSLGFDFDTIFEYYKQHV